GAGRAGPHVRGAAADRGGLAHEQLLLNPMPKHPPGPPGHDCTAEPLPPPGPREPLPDELLRPVAHLRLKAALLLLFTLSLVVGSALYLMYARGAFEPTQRL